MAFLVYGQSTSITGIGAIDTVSSFADGSSVTYTVSGQIPADPPQRLSGAIELTLSERQVDLDLNDNRIDASVLTSLIGDIDRNRIVNFEDFLILQAHFGQAKLATREQGDLDGDGRVAFSDFVILSANFGRT